MSWVTLAVSPSAVEELIAAAENLELYFALPHSSVDVDALADAEDDADGDAGGNARDDAEGAAAEGDRREAAGAAGKDSKASAASSASAAAGNSR